MSFPHSIINRIHDAIQQMKITSAGGKNPVNNEVKQPFNITEAGLNEEFSREVVQIIKDEIKIQMTEFRDNPPTPKSKPEDSTFDKAQDQVGEITAIIKNPSGFIASGIRLLPAAAIAFLAKEVAEEVFVQITKEGGIMDLRWKREMEKEQNAFLSRQTKRETQLGVRPVVINQSNGFTALNPALNYNNQKIIRDHNYEGAVDPNLRLVDHAKGLF